jgi:hypothetical protein
MVFVVASYEIHSKVIGIHKEPIHPGRIGRSRCQGRVWQGIILDGGPPFQHVEAVGTAARAGADVVEARGQAVGGLPLGQDGRQGLEMGVRIAIEGGGVGDEDIAGAGAAFDSSATLVGDEQTATATAGDGAPAGAATVPRSGDIERPADYSFLDADGELEMHWKGRGGDLEVRFGTNGKVVDQTFHHSDPRWFQKEILKTRAGTSSP